MSTLNISLPEPMRAYIEARINQGQYASASDYIRDLIREDQKRQAETDLETKLLAALDSGRFEKVTPEFFERLRQRARSVKKSAQ